MHPAWWWGSVLDGVGLTASWFTGNKRRIGWVIAVICMGLWAVYSVLTKQWGFFPGIIIATVVYVRNWRKWKRDEQQEEVLGV